MSPTQVFLLGLVLASVIPFAQAQDIQILFEILCFIMEVAALLLGKYTARESMKDRLII